MPSSDVGCGIARGASAFAFADAGQAAAREKARKSAVKKREKEGGGKVDDGGPVHVGRIVVIDDDCRDGGGGGGGGEGTPKTTTEESTLSLAMTYGSDVVSDLRSIGRLSILRDDPRNDSYLICNRKRCELGIKFRVHPGEYYGKDDPTIVRAVPMAMTAPNDGGGDAGLNIDVDDMSRLMSTDIRVREGMEYMDRRILANARREERRRAREEEEEERARLLAEEMARTTLIGGGGEDDGASPSPAVPDDDDDMVVTAWEVSGSIDYNKLIEKFGSRPLTPYLLRRLENVTVLRGTVPRLHRFLRRGIFFSHRDIERICELLEGWYGIDPPCPDEDGDDAADATAGVVVEYAPPATPCPIYLYTGRGPSSAAMHLGHLVPFLFTAWLQKAFRCPLVVQMTDDEKFIFKGEYSGFDDAGGDGAVRTGDDDDDRTGDNLDYFAKLTIENAKDIIACDFDYDRTFLFSDLEYVGRMYPNIVRIWKAVTVNQVNGIFGFDGTANIGKAAFPAVQAAPSFGSSFPIVLGGGGSVNASTLACLIPCAIDQDPYFRLTRDVAHKLVPRRHPLGGKPALLHSKFFPPLQGAKGKMSSSDPNSAIFLTDTEAEIERKIKVHAFSGGRETKDLQMKHGANLDVDVSYQWLRFFLEDDDELDRIGREYESGSGEFWSTGAVKAKLVQVLKELVREHQERRTMVTDEVVREWMTERCIA
jgi:tryptophanyl-tRNA synthetase